MAEINKPERKYVLSLELGADSIDDIYNELNHIIYTLQTHPNEERHIASGGYHSGFDLKLRHNEGQTHDNYIDQLNQYIKDKKL